MNEDGIDWVRFHNDPVYKAQVNEYLQMKWLPERVFCAMLRHPIKTLRCLMTKEVK